MAAADLRPRFGAFITIVALLMVLFGGLSRARQFLHWRDSLTPEREVELEREAELDRKRTSAMIVIGVSPEPLPQSDGAGGEEPRSPRRATPTPRRVPPQRPTPGQRSFPAPRPQPRRPVKYYTVGPRDTLYEIAGRFYGRGADWKRIAAANPGLDPNRIPTGTVLRIPVDEISQAPAPRATY